MMGKSSTSTTTPSRPAGSTPETGGCTICGGGGEKAKARGGGRAERGTWQRPRLLFELRQEFLAAAVSGGEQGRVPYSYIRNNHPPLRKGGECSSFQPPRERKGG